MYPIVGETNHIGREMVTLANKGVNDKWRLLLFDILGNLNVTHFLYFICLVIRLCGDWVGWQFDSKALH